MRKIIKYTLAPVLFIMVLSSVFGQSIKIDRPFPSLAFANDALEPFIDATTMDVHYNMHYKGYYSKFLKATEGTELESMTMESIFASISSQNSAVRNNGGGYYNHLLFWENLSPQTGEPSNELSEAIKNSFGSFNEFKNLFEKEASTLFGSGWTWLILTSEGKLAVTTTANQDNPLMDTNPIKGIPLLALDIWEHAYYLKYQNRRYDYILAFWNIINWETVSKRYAECNLEK